LEKTKAAVNKISLFLLAVVLVSALFVVTVRHQNRLSFIYLQNMEAQRDQLQSEWGRLMIEKATWAMEHNIADDAGTRLGMSPPPPDKIITVQLDGNL
jgi:cell division protein FtsL